jgi:hypothetical protein
VAFCPTCGSGYRAGPLVCADCQTELRPRSWVETNLGLEDDSGVEPVVLADVENTFQAQVLASALRDSTIRFATQPLAPAVLRFLVHPVDIESARQVLSDIDEGIDPGGS